VISSLPRGSIVQHDSRKRSQHGFKSLFERRQSAIRPLRKAVSPSPLCCGHEASTRTHDSHKQTISTRKGTACLCLLPFSVQSLLYPVPTRRALPASPFVRNKANMCVVIGSIDHATSTCRMCKAFKPQFGRYCACLHPIAAHPNILILPRDVLTSQMFVEIAVITRQEMSSSTGMPKVCPSSMPSLTTIVALTRQLSHIVQHMWVLQGALLKLVPDELY
jgi:hypothetical protein